MSPRTSRQAAQEAYAKQAQHYLPVKRVMRGAKREDFEPDGLWRNIRRVIRTLWRI